MSDRVFKTILCACVLSAASMLAGPSSAAAEVTSYSEVFRKTEIGNPSRTVTFFQYSSQDVLGVTHPNISWGMHVGDLGAAIASGQVYTGVGRYDRTRITTRWNNNPCCTGAYPGESFGYATENYPFTLQNANGVMAQIYECRGFVSGRQVNSVHIPGIASFCIE